MRTVTLNRRPSSAEGTFGALRADDGFSCFTGELPWRDNLPNKSCIPLGTYLVIYRKSPRHGMCYHVENVQGRTDIEIHSANFVGDVDRKFRSQLLGCIALGWGVKELNGQMAVINSREALAAFEEHMNKEDFELAIS